jgi:hypothetical protein
MKPLTKNGVREELPTSTVYCLQADRLVHLQHLKNLLPADSTMIIPPLNDGMTLGYREAQIRTRLRLGGLRKLIRMIEGGQRMDATIHRDPYPTVEGQPWPPTIRDQDINVTKLELSCHDDHFFAEMTIQVGDQVFARARGGLCRDGSVWAALVPCRLAAPGVFYYADRLVTVLPRSYYSALFNVVRREILCRIKDGDYDYDLCDGRDLDAALNSRSLAIA